MIRRALSAIFRPAPTASPDVRLAPPTRTDLLMMRRALDLAENAGADGEVPVGAVVYDTLTGDLIAEAANTREHQRVPTGHAEVDAITEACAAIGDWRLNDCTLVVTLEPCPMCAGLIVNARVGRVVFGARDPKMGACVSLYRMVTDRRLNHRAELVGDVHAAEAGDLLREFFRARRGK